MFYSLKSTRGSLAQGLGIMVFIGFVAFALSQMSSFLSKTVKRKMAASRSSSTAITGAETMLIAYRMAELTYMTRVAACTTARPFFDALRLGSNCAGATTGGSIRVFSNLGAQDIGVTEGVYLFPGAGCDVQQNLSTCANGMRNLVNSRMAGETRALATTTGYRFALNGFAPQRQLLEFSASIDNFADATAPPEGRFSFAIRASLPNAAHLEADGRVTQEEPDPLSPCTGSIWATFNVFNPATQSCLTFAQHGSGTGLAYYRDRYFGFRPWDGQVIDLLASSTLPTYLVDETGDLAGVPVFPPYNKAALVNVDDITIVGTQVYYVAFSGPEAHIGVYSSLIPAPAEPRARVCALGTKGWGQSYEGIAAYMPSDMLVPNVAGESGAPRLATFFLKTTSGDNLMAVVNSRGRFFPGTATVNVPGDMQFDCEVFKIASAQQVEYSRTNGFDRTEGGKPYILY